MCLLFLNISIVEICSTVFILFDDKIISKFKKLNAGGTYEIHSTVNCLSRNKPNILFFCSGY